MVPSSWDTGIKVNIRECERNSSSCLTEMGKKKTSPRCSAAVFEWCLMFAALSGVAHHLGCLVYIHSMVIGR